jgi:hypothetical protein
LLADDLCAYIIYKQKRTIVKTIQLYLDRIEKWLKTWLLQMAPQKCNYIVFSNDKSHKNGDDLNLKLQGDNNLKSESPLFLGIRFDKHLSFKNQLNYLKEACMKRINVLVVNKSHEYILLQYPTEGS